MTPAIDCKRIPNAEMNVLANALIGAAERFYKDPENMKKFEAWKKEKMEGRQSDRNQADN